MKNTILILVLLLHTLMSYGQTLTMDKVPKEVRSAFRAKYPSAQQESWQAGGADMYQVAFYANKKGLTASFDKSGKWIQTETDITEGQVPRAVNQAIAKGLPGSNIQSISQVEGADGAITYTVVWFKGTENGYVRYSAKGEVLSAAQ